MIEDRSLYMSLDQALTATAASTDYIPLTTAKNLGIGETLYWVVQVSSLLDAAGAVTLDMVLQGDPSSAAFGAAVTLITIPQKLKAALGLGATFIYPLPIFAADQKFLRTNYTIATGPFTTGTIRSHITKNPQLYASQIAPYPQ